MIILNRRVDFINARAKAFLAIKEHIVVSRYIVIGARHYSVFFC